MKRTRSPLGMKLRSLDRRLDLPPSVRAKMERSLCTESLRSSLRVIMKFFRARATARARLSRMTRQQREIIVQIFEGTFKPRRQSRNSRDLDALVRAGCVRMYSSVPRLTDSGTRVAVGELHGRRGDVLAAMQGLPWPKKKRAEWAMEVLASVVRCFTDEASHGKVRTHGKE